MTKQRPRTRRVFVVTLIAPLLLIIQPPGTGAQTAEPADLKATFEGTWELVEWHVDGRVLRPPEINGFWSNNHGVVIANFSRQSEDIFESFIGYGTYDFDATDWSYTYERIQVTSGPSVDKAAITIGTGTPQRFKITREAAKVILEGTDDRREYVDGFFLYMPNDQLLRKYRKVN